MKNIDEIDTIVCSAKSDNLKKVFLAKKKWYPVRINSKMIHRLKYLAMYETSPISAIRYIGTIKKIEPFENSNDDSKKKYQILLKGKPQEIPPIKMTKESITRTPQAPRYTTKKLINNGKTLLDIFPI